MSGVVATFFQLVAAERADFLVDRKTVLGNFVAVLLSMFGGPFILARNAFSGLSEGRLPLAAAVVMAVVAIFWSLCTGIVYLAVAFAA